MPCHVYLMKQVQGYSKLFSTHIGQDFDHLYAFFAFILNLLDPQDYYFDHGLWYPTISTLSISFFFCGQGFPSMSTLAQNTFIFFWYSFCICPRFQGAFLAIFSRQIEPHFLSLFTSYPLYMDPHPYGVSLGSGITPQNRLEYQVNLFIHAH